MGHGELWVSWSLLQAAETEPEGIVGVPWSRGIVGVRVFSSSASLRVEPIIKHSRPLAATIQSVAAPSK